MPFLPDVNVSALASDDNAQQLQSLVQQINEWGRLISNEELVTVYKDQAGTNRYMIGLLPDNTVGIRVSKENVDVVSAADTDLIYKSNFSTDTYYDTANSRILLGELPDGTFGLVISKSGTDVEDLF